MGVVGRGRLPSLAVLVVALALPGSAVAQATRTWVSGVGDDANPCSRTAPCKTFAGAIAKTDQGGEINVLDSGGFGAVTITKSITISAVGVTAGVLVAGTNGIVINTSSDVAPGDPDRDVVTLKGLDIDGLGLSAGVSAGLNGVLIQHAGSVRLENDEIYGFGQDGVLFAPTTPTETGAPAPSLYIENSTIHDNAQDGVLALPPASKSARVVIENSQFENNGCGIAAGVSIAAFSTASCGTAATGTGTIEVDSASTSSSTNTGAGYLVQRRHRDKRPDERSDRRQRRRAAGAERGRHRLNRRRQQRVREHDQRSSNLESSDRSRKASRRTWATGATGKQVRPAG